MMKFIQFRIGDVVQMKKQHPCGSSEWEVLQLGSDMRVKCRGCGRIVLIARPKFLKGAKKVFHFEKGMPDCHGCGNGGQQRRLVL